MSRSLLVALGFVVATGMAAADAGRDALVLLDRGISLYKAGSFGEAREAFDRARELVPDKANPYRWLGLTDAQLGRCAEAISALEVFISRVPAGDSRVMEAVAVRDRCREELAPKFGVLVVDSNPPAAEVRLDSEGAPPLGVTPLRRDDIPVGQHFLFLRRAGYSSLQRSFHVDRGQTVHLELSLAALPPPAPVVVPVAASAPEPLAPAPQRRKPRYWIIGVAVGAAAVAAVGLGLGLGLRGGETELPPIQAR